jgi:hypothetical protein
MDFVKNEICKFCLKITGGDRHLCFKSDLIQTENKILLCVYYLSVYSEIELDYLQAVNNSTTTADVFFSGKKYNLPYQFRATTILSNNTKYTYRNPIKRGPYPVAQGLHCNIFEILNQSACLVEAFESLQLLTLFN